VDLQGFLTEKRALVEKALRTVCSSFPSSSRPLKEAMEYSLFSEGKRIRPSLAMAACEALGCRSEAVLPFAAGIEMIHAYSLIHDDLPCMDNDDLRRGRPTCHKVFGEAIALLAGDALLTEAFRVMADRRNSEVSSSTARRIIYEVALAAGASGMVAGQTMDVAYEGKKGTKAIVNYIHSHKTGALIRASVLAGAFAGRAKAVQAKGFRIFGESIGMAFQIRDDLLDVEGTEEEVGKKLLKDADKQTYVKYYGVTASKDRIGVLIDRAESALAFLGEKAEVLVGIARFAGNRSF
jgi:geranylgeranyl diphosphate synthase, type II